MLKNDVYFSYLCDLALKRERNEYTKLCHILHNRAFEYIIDMDENRYTDGLELRQEYFNNNAYFKNDLSILYKNRPCSVLEMMVALARRCYHSILSVGGSRDKTNEIFKLMLVNLGLDKCTDDNIGEEFVNQRIDDLLNRTYSPDGRGSLFYIPNIQEDMRQVDLWYQAMWYIDSIIN